MVRDLVVVGALADGVAAPCVVVHGLLRDLDAAVTAAIAERDGIAIVQDPDTVAHRSMPCSAPCRERSDIDNEPGEWQTMRHDRRRRCSTVVGRGLRSQCSELHPVGEGRGLCILPGGVW